MLSDCQGTNSSKGIFVFANAAHSTESAQPSAEAPEIYSHRVPDQHARAGGSLDPADSRGARGVLAFYSVIIVALLGAALLGVHPGGGKPATTSVVERGSLDSSASGPGSAGK